MKELNNKITKLTIPIYCKLKDSNIIYILKEIQNKKAILIFNSKKLIVDEKDILIMENYRPRKEILQETRYSFTPALKTDENSSTTELMLRLLTIDESLPLLDKFIDNAVILKLPYVKIIHGKKGGVIRKAVHAYLDKSEFVDSYTYAEYYDGSYGATVAQIKRWN